MTYNICDDASSSASSLQTSAPLALPTEVPESNDFACLDLGIIIRDMMDVRQMSDAEKCKYSKEHFVPPVGYDKFCSQIVKSRGEEKKLVFQRKWLDDYKWLVYSPLLSGGLCKYCILFPPKVSSNVGVLVNKAFTNLRKAKGLKDGILDNHNRLEYHKDAMSASENAILTLNNPKQQIDYILDKQRKEIFDGNIHVLNCVVNAVIFCGKQNIALRGHRDDTTSKSSNHGNFLATLDLMAKSDQVLYAHLETGKRNAKYTSKTIQNEIINLIGEYIRNKLTHDIKKGSPSPFYSIMADEVTDEYSNREILSVCLRFLQNGTENVEIVEYFIDFAFMKRTTGEAISQSIINILESNGLLLDNLRGQAYDGASAMSSERNGVNGRIKRIAPKAIYTHCNSHVLNLAIAASCKLPVVRNMIGTVNETYMFFHYSPKRQRFFEQVLAALECESTKKKLLGLCKTRWVERHSCYDTFHELFIETHYCLDAIVNPGMHDDVYSGEVWSWDAESRTKAQGLLTTIESFAFIVTFLIAKNCLESVKPVAKLLQSSDLDCYEAHGIIQQSITELKSMRTDIETTFKDWYADAVKLCEDVHGTVAMPRITGRQRHRENNPSSNPEEYFRKTVAISFLDHMTTEMDSRFSEDSKKCHDLFGLIPKVITKSTDVGQLHEDLQFWKSDIPTPLSLRYELNHWKKTWATKLNESTTPSCTLVPESLIQSYRSCNEAIFPNIKVLLAIACVTPVGSASAERSFSGLRRIKTYLRNSMGEERLAGLALMHIHHSTEIDESQIIGMFLRKHRRRLFLGSVLDF